jgi:hypothetical protein
VRPSDVIVQTSVAWLIKQQVVQQCQSFIYLVVVHHVLGFGQVSFDPINFHFISSFNIHSGSGSPNLNVELKTTN